MHAAQTDDMTFDSVYDDKYNTYDTASQIRFGTCVEIYNIKVLKGSFSRLSKCSRRPDFSHAPIATLSLSLLNLGAKNARKDIKMIPLKLFRIIVRNPKKHHGEKICPCA